MGVCLRETSTDPIYIIDRLMSLPFCHMHGPEHHVMVGAALLTAYSNAGGEVELETAQNNQCIGSRCPFFERRHEA